MLTHAATRDMMPATMRQEATTTPPATDRDTTQRKAAISSSAVNGGTLLTRGDDMFDMDHPVSRRTVSAYRIGVTGAVEDKTGTRLVATLHGSPATGDWLTIREAGRSKGVTYDVAGLYQQGLVRRAKMAMAGRG